MVPVRLTLSPVVHWVDVGGASFSEPFFGETVGRLMGAEPPPATCATELSKLISVADMLPRVTPAAMIFHVSRCGSTLVANALKTAQGVAVVSEAQPFNALLMPNALPDARRRRVLRSLVRVFGSDQEGSGLKLVIKFSSWNILSIAFLRSLWPRTPCLVIVREPIEVMVSNLEGGAGWMRFKRTPELAAAVFGWVPADVERMSLEEYTGRVLGLFCKAASESADDCCRLLDYSDLSPSAMRRVAEYLGIPLSADADALARVMKTYSKDPAGKRAFRGDREDKLRRATPTMIEAAKTWAEPEYARLKNLGRGL